MTSGLKWWHGVCKEVRESGSGWAGGVHFNSFDPYSHNGERRIKTCVQFAVDKVSRQRRDLKVPAYEFLRTQWLAAYRKAKSHV